jgi:hypothetical protein
MVLSIDFALPGALSRKRLRMQFDHTIGHQPF